MGKKNLEQLFRDTFKDFQKTPDDAVWNSIEATLDNKKQKRRVVPIWWQLGGAAAALALLFYLLSPLSDSTNQEEIITTDVEQQDIKLNDQGESSDQLFKEPTIEQGKEESLTEVSKEHKTQLNSDTETLPQSTEKEDFRKDLTPNGKKNSFVTNNESAVASNSELEKEKVSAFNEVSVAQANEASNKDLDKNDSKILPEGISEEQAVAERSDNLSKSEKNSISNVLESESTDENALAENENEVAEDPEKKSIFDVISEQEEEEIAEVSSKKWSVGPSVAPVYFNGSGDGSPIHSSFASNSKSGNINLSYGLTVAYHIGKKLKIRSGVHRVNYGYDTNEVLFSSSLEASTNETINNINYNETSRALVVESKNTVQGKSLSDTSVELAANEISRLEGKMVQQLGYIEVPLELNYTVIDKKFGLNVIGGVSSLFLVDNSVLLESQDLVTEMGEANNANSVNYSTNIGLGLNYEISPKVQFNLEPVFKYQLNTFSETAGPFRPYSVGVYSGVSFRF